MKAGFPRHRISASQHQDYQALDKACRAGDYSDLINLVARAVAYAFRFTYWWALGIEADAAGAYLEELGYGA